MSLPTSNNNPEPSLTTLVRDGSLGRKKSKVGCPAGLSLLLSSGNNNGGGGGGSSSSGSRRRVVTTCNSRNSINERNDLALCKDEGDIMTKEIMAGEEVGSANDIGRRSTSLISSSFLARVDPILDFWTVDEELIGRFLIISWVSQHQQAVIFKVKTTGPHRFCVRPICGIMRPNVVATVEVKCERRILENDEFLVEVAPVPGAIAAMTNDLYTSAVPSNFPELMAVWERIDQDIKEFHRISCRFHRTTQHLERFRFPSQIKEQLVEEGQVGRFDESGLGDNNNFRISNNDAEDDTTAQYLCYENCSFTQPTEIKCYLARETADPQGQDYVKGASHQGEQSYRSKVRRFQILSLILGLLLILALVYISFSLFHNGSSVLK